MPLVPCVGVKPYCYPISHPRNVCARTQFSIVQDPSRSHYGATLYSLHLNLLSAALTLCFAWEDATSVTRYVKHRVQ